jgi:hypothetical protein
MFELNFKAAENRGENNYEPIPEGIYPVQCAEASVDKVKSGNGYYLKAKLKIVGGKHANRTLFARFNIQNPNPTAERIGKEQLAAFMDAAGITTLTDPTQLVGANVSVKVIVKTQEGQEPSNEIRAYKKIGPTVDSSQAAESVPF